MNRTIILRFEVEPNVNWKHKIERKNLIDQF